MYITQSGDTWDIIAKRVYGSELCMTDLMKANPEHMRTVIFPSSVRLQTPELKTIKQDANLPPWTRGRG